MNLLQRIALLLALGVVLHVSSQVILFEDPRTLTASGDARYGGGVQLIVMSVHIGAWLAVALWLLRDRGPGDRT